MGQGRAVGRTGRLRLRQFTEADVSNLLELNSDPDVMRFITGGRPDSLEQVQASCGSVRDVDLFAVAA